MSSVRELKLVSKDAQGLSLHPLNQEHPGALPPACPLYLLPTGMTLGVRQGQFFLEVEEQVGRPPRFHPNPNVFLDCNEQAPDSSPPGQLPLLL